MFAHRFSVRFRLSTLLATLLAGALVASSVQAQVGPNTNTNGQTATARTVDNVTHQLQALSPTGEIVKRSPGGYVAAMFGLSAATVGDSAEERARSFLELWGPAFGYGIDGSELRLERVSTGQSGIAYVRFNQWLNDRFVVSAEIVVWLHNDLVIGVTGNLRPGSVDLPGEPTITDLTAYQALTDLAADGELLLPKVSNAEVRSRMRLVYIPQGDGLRLVWGVDVPEAHVADSKIAFIDAISGELVYIRDLTRTLDDANAWQPSPGETGDLPVTPVTLTGRDDAQDMLTGPLLRSFNCVNQGERIEFFNGQTVPVCSEVQLATADTNGDFLFQPVFSDDNTMDPETGELMRDVDRFAETHMFYHVMEVYTWYQSLGLGELREKPFRAVVNARQPDFFGGTDSLVPYDNAFYTPAGPLFGSEDRPEDSIVFGQGTTADFSYDGDVIYHEFTHAVIDSTAGLEFGTFDQLGYDTAPGAMHEGYADYFAAAFTEDSVIGDYVGPALDEQFAGNGLRDIDDDIACPNHIVGETHIDSAHFSGGLWDVRTELIDTHGLTPAQADGFVYESMQGLDPQANYTVAGRALDTVLRVDNESAADAVFPLMEERGVIGCERVIDLTDGAVKEELYTLGPRGAGLDPWVPAPMQFKVTLPENSDELTLGWLSPPSFRGTPTQITVLMRPQNPVDFSYFGAQVNNNSVRQAEMVKVGTEVIQTSQGPFEIPRYEVTFSDLNPGDFYFALVQSNRRQAQLYDIKANYDLAEPPMDVAEDAGEDVGSDVSEDVMDPAADTGMEITMEGADAGVVSQENADEGCGCVTVRGDSGTENGPGRGELPWVMFGLVVIGFVLRRARG